MLRSEGGLYTHVRLHIFDWCVVLSGLGGQSLEKYLHGPMKGKNMTDEVIDQRAAELAKAHRDAQLVGGGTKG